MSGYSAIELDGFAWNLVKPVNELSLLASPSVIQVSDPVTGTLLLSAATAARSNWRLTSVARATPTGWVMGDISWYVYLPSSVPHPDSPEPYLLSAATTEADVVSLLESAMKGRTPAVIPLDSGPFSVDGATLPFAVVGQKPPP